MSKTIILLALLGLSISKIMVLDNVQDLRELTNDTENRQLDFTGDSGMLNENSKRLLVNDSDIRKLDTGDDVGFVSCSVKRLLEMGSKAAVAAPKAHKELARNRKLDTGDDVGFTSCSVKRLLEMGSKKKHKAKKAHKKHKDTSERKLDSTDDIGFTSCSVKRLLEMSRKHEMKAETQHKNLDMTRDFLCYKNNGTYKILTLVVSSAVDMEYKTDRGCAKLVAL